MLALVVLLHVVGLVQIFLILIVNKEYNSLSYLSFETHFIIIIIKRGWQCKAGRERLTPYQSEDRNPTTPTHRKKEEKGKTVGDKNGASS